MKCILIAGVLAIATLAPAATAGGTTVVVTGIVPTQGGGVTQKGRIVEYGDLDIASVQGAATLLSRIERSAEAVCTSTVGQRSLMDERQTERCRSRAVKDAVSGVGSPQLNAAARK